MLPLLEKIIAVKKPVSGLPKSLLAQYEAIGTASTFRVEPIEKGLLFMGKTAKVALKVEFGNRWEFFNTITALRETDADIKVLVTSSNSKAMSMETIYTVLKKKLEEKKRWVLIDLEGKKETMLLNFAHTRSKPSSRKRPEPKARKKPEPEIKVTSAGHYSQNWEDRRKRRSTGPNLEMKKSKNYGMQPVNAKPRRKKIYGKRRKK